MNQQNKPKKHLDLLGPQVEIRNKDLPKDTHTSNMLRDMGKRLGEAIPTPGFRYVGSYATHIYANELGREAHFIHQNAFDKAVPEAIVSTSAADQSVYLMRVLFGRDKPATRDERDQRGKKTL